MNLLLVTLNETYTSGKTLTIFKLVNVSFTLGGITHYHRVLMKYLYNDIHYSRTIMKLILSDYNSLLGHLNETI